MRLHGTGDVQGTSPSVGALKLDVIIDAREATRSGSAYASHTWLSNALCMPARLGVFIKSSQHLSIGSSSTVLVDDHATAARLNSDWWFGEAARVGDAEAGRRAAVAAVKAGHGFVLAPVTALWTQDLRDALFMDTPGNVTDRPGVHTDLTCDVAMSGGGGPDTSFLGVRPTRAGRRFVEAALQCEAATVVPIDLKGRLAGRAVTSLPPSDALSPIFSSECLLNAATVSSPDVRVCTQTTPAFQMTLDSFDKHGPAKTGLWPTAVVVKPEESASSLQARGLWSLAPDGSCPVTLAHTEAVPPKAKTTASPPFSLRIRVLTMDRPASLHRLLNSMLAADYLGDRVSLDLVVDAPPPDESEDAAAAAIAHAETAAIVSAFVWPHGPKSVDIAIKSRGLINQWLAWRPERDDEACLVLEDDMQMAPTFYAWAKTRLTAYWAAASVRSGDDALASKLSAISLSLQNKVVGEIDGLQMYGHTDIGRLLADGAPPAYLAAQVSSWAPILLPRPWRHFLSWWDHERLHVPTRRYFNGTKVALSPCLPGLASNQWWAKSLDTIWTVWWHRFAVTTGYVVLYQDPRAGPAQAVNHKEPGEHFKAKQSVTGALPSSSSSPSEDFIADLPTLPVYDLHMRPLGPAGGSGLRALTLRGDFVANAPAFGGSCEWVGMTKKQRSWLDLEEGTGTAAAEAGSSSLKT